MKRLHTQLLGAPLEISYVELPIIRSRKPLDRDRFFQLIREAGEVVVGRGAISVVVLVSVDGHDLFSFR